VALPSTALTLSAPVAKRRVAGRASTEGWIAGQARRQGPASALPGSASTVAASRYLDRRIGCTAFAVIDSFKGGWRETGRGQLVHQIARRSDRESESQSR
jgi:hypothetical protein